MNLHAAASFMGKRSYQSRLERLGLERLQEIARENGKKGGRPKGSGKRREVGMVTGSVRKSAKQVVKRAAGSEVSKRERARKTGRGVAKKGGK